MRVRYEKWTPGPEASALLRIADDICADYGQQGYDLTLRQLYYQFVARGHIANNQQSYNKLGSIVNRGRLAGLLDWDYIVDRTRNLEGVSHWETPSDIINGAARSFRLDKWTQQPVRVEVWVEKEALAGVIGRTATARDVDYFSCRGYVSQSELWGAAQRLGRYIDGGQGVVILHLGDHDPSGIDMTRDIEDRLTRFLTQDWYNNREPESNSRIDILADMADHTGYEPAFEVRRIALNMDQVEQYDPPPNPAKVTDSRATRYIAEYGRQSWELDALDPTVLDALIQTELDSLMEHAAYAARQGEEDTHRRLLMRASQDWTTVVERLGAE